MVTGDDGALASKTGLAEHLVTFTSLIDAGADQHGIAATIGQPGLALEVEQNIGHYLLQPRTTGEQLLHRGPLLFKLLLAQSGETLGLGVEPLIYLLLGFDSLIDIPRLVAQIQHHAITHRLVELVGVNVRAEYFDGFFLVQLHQRRAGKTDKQRLWQQALHGPMQLAGLGAVALIDKDKQLALGAEVRGQAATHISNKIIRAAVIFVI